MLASETGATPQTALVFYKGEDGEVPVLDWLRALRRRDRRAYEETLKAQIARMVYEARTAAGLTQRALAARIGTKPSVIARLEDADVDSDALFLLHRIAAALGTHWTFVWSPYPSNGNLRELCLGRGH